MRYFIAIFLLVVPFSVLAEEPIRVVATLPTFASLVEEIGGEQVAVKAVASPNFNPHFIEAKPSDVLRLKRAELFVHGGLDLEAWRSPLVNAAGNLNVRPGEPGELDLSVGIKLLEVPTEMHSRSEGDIHLFGNPHYHVDPRAGLVMARAISAKLVELRPQSRSYFEGRLAAFESKLHEAMDRWLELAIKTKGIKLVGYHNEWIYLVDFLGAEMSEFLEPKPGIPPSPQHVEKLMRYIKDNGVKAIVQSSYFPTDVGDRLSSDSGVPLLLLCQNVGEAPECSNFIGLMDYNIKSLAEVASDE